MDTLLHQSQPYFRRRAAFAPTYARIWLATVFTFGAQSVLFPIETLNPQLRPAGRSLRPWYSIWNAVDLGGFGALLAALHAQSALFEKVLAMTFAALALARGMSGDDTYGFWQLVTAALFVDGLLCVLGTSTF